MRVLGACGLKKRVVVAVSGRFHHLTESSITINFCSILKS